MKTRKISGFYNRTLTKSEIKALDKGFYEFIPNDLKRADIWKAVQNDGGILLMKNYKNGRNNKGNNQ